MVNGIIMSNRRVATCMPYEVRAHMQKVISLVEHNRFLNHAHAYVEHHTLVKKKKETLFKKKERVNSPRSVGC